MKATTDLHLVDRKSTIDYRSRRLDKNHARKLVSEILTRYPQNVRFGGHARKELLADRLTTQDALNVLKSPASKITREPEMRNGSYRYCLETSKIAVVVSFDTGQSLAVVTAWRQGATRHALHKL